MKNPPIFPLRQCQSAAPLRHAAVRRTPCSVPLLGLALATALLVPHGARAQAAAESEAPSNAELRQRIAEQARQLDQLRRALAAQEATLESLRRSVDARGAEAARPATSAGARSAAATSESAMSASAMSASASPQSAALAPTPSATDVGSVGEAPPGTNAAPQVAKIFEQAGVLTPAGGLSLEPSLQYSYSSSSRVALVGYTVIPAILVGLIDVREVKRSTLTGALALRYGVTNRFEVEAKLPYVYRSDTSIGREIGSGADSNSAIFGADGHGIGDAEFTARYQLNEGGADKAYYVGSLRFKSRTGRDPFEIPVSTTTTGFSGEGVQSELPTGSGFYGIQPALTMLYPSDPAVFFGTVSYLHSIKRHNVTTPTDEGPQNLGTIAPGGIFGFNFGMGVALNERSSFSIGYDHSIVTRTRQNGQAAADSVQLQLGTLLLGYSYRLDEKRSLNLSLGAGITRDTPDVTLTLRVPTAF